MDFGKIHHAILNTFIFVSLYTQEERETLTKEKGLKSYGRGLLNKALTAFESLLDVLQGFHADLGAPKPKLVAAIVICLYKH